jgi:hypothetical protein
VVVYVLKYIGKQTNGKTSRTSVHQGSQLAYSVLLLLQEGFLLQKNITSLILLGNLVIVEQIMF